ncbi:hypothetical protein ACLB2K_055155 [Fragaria x ananassa]
MLGTRGTAGYIAPEVFSRNFGGVSHKSDVYSYGMLVLDMVGARRNLHSDASHTSETFPHYVYKDLELGNDESIFRSIPEEENETVRKMILISLRCIQTIPSDRPSMSKVIEMLEGPLHSLAVPPKPFLFSPTESAINEQSSSDAEESMIKLQESETCLTTKYDRDDARVVFKSRIRHKLLRTQILLAREPVQQRLWFPVFESASEALDRNITDIQTAIDGGFEMDVLNDNGGFAAMAWHHEEFAGKTLLSAQFSCFLPGFIFTNSKFIRYLDMYSPIIN